jgi:hypothetical protein
MPLCRKPSDYNLVVDKSMYFDTLDALDDWATNPPKKLTDVVKYTPSGRDYPVRGLPDDSQGKLLVSVHSLLTKSIMLTAVSYLQGMSRL